MNPEICFYTNIDNKIIFLCQLLQKILETTEYKTVVLTDGDVKLQQELSHSLWTMIPDSFLANEILTLETSDPLNLSSSIIITSLQKWHQKINNVGILVDLTFSKIEYSTTHLNKIILIVGKNVDESTIAQSLYQHYQINQLTLKHFDMSQY